MTPALRALREHFPEAELHVLVPQEMTPLFQHLPWLNRVWGMPRHRGHASLSETWPFIAALRRERFDRSVDFAGNDRGAILSRLIGSRQRLSWTTRHSRWWRTFCYHQQVLEPEVLPHESRRLAQLLSAWQVPSPRSYESEIRPNPTLMDEARRLLPSDNVILCHIASSQPKKEWPVKSWVEFYHLAGGAGLKLAFTTARGQREASLIDELKSHLPEAEVLPEIADLALFLAVLARSRGFVSGDTGPLHFAAGLGVPTLSLFGPTSPNRWAPLGEKHRYLVGGPCECSGHSAVCQAPKHCLMAAPPAKVLSALQDLLLLK